MRIAVSMEEHQNQLINNESDYASIMETPLIQWQEVESAKWDNSYNWEVKLKAPATYKGRN